MHRLPSFRLKPWARVLFIFFFFNNRLHPFRGSLALPIFWVTGGRAADTHLLLLFLFLLLFLPINDGVLHDWWVNIRIFAVFNGIHILLQPFGMSRSFFSCTLQELLISGKSIFTRKHWRAVQLWFFKGPLLDNLTLRGLILRINNHGDIFLVKTLLASHGFRRLLRGRWNFLILWSGLATLLLGWTRLWIAFWPLRLFTLRVNQLTHFFIFRCDLIVRVSFHFGWWVRRRSCLIHPPHHFLTFLKRFLFFYFC